MKLLFITQKLHGQDAFGALWAHAFAERGYEVTVLCLESRPELIAETLGTNGAMNFVIRSMGKEKNDGKLKQVLRFWKVITTLKYDRVFIHMAPVWGFLGAPVFIARRVPTYLWYTHYKMQIGLRMIALYGKRMFCATKQSMPQYEGDPKKIVTGHGIDMRFWPKRENVCRTPHRLLGVYRLSRSKRLELCIHAFTLLPSSYTWDIYGVEAEPEYAKEMKELVTSMQLQERIRFHGTAAAKDLPGLYVKHRLILNMASETIDKTMLEAMTCGCYPVTTKGNAVAIGITDAPETDTPEAIAAFILAHEKTLPMTAEQMYATVEKGHSLSSLIEKMDVYIHPGT
jgi:glycosyltransferase involved in cell wall biosynthesis